MIDTKLSGSDELDGLVLFEETATDFLRAAAAATGDSNGASSGTGVDSLESRDCVEMDEEVSERQRNQHKNMLN